MKLKKIEDPKFGFWQKQLRLSFPRVESPQYFEELKVLFIFVNNNVTNMTTRKIYQDGDINVGGILY